jgi:hypothetical protein
MEVRVVDTKKNTARELVREAKKLKETDRDRVWAVFDKDGYTLHAQAFCQARANDINIAFSSICFEYWILLHFEYTTRPFANCDELVDFMGRACGYRYDKTDPLTYEKTKGRISTAKANASRCREYQANCNSVKTPVYELNPYTNVDELVITIEEFSANE